MKNEKLILEYLDIRYGDCEIIKTESCISIKEVGLYGKKSNIVGFTGYVHAELVDWFGEGRYHPELKKWFCKKCEIEIDNDVMVMMQ